MADERALWHITRSNLLVNPDERMLNDINALVGAHRTLLVSGINTLPYSIINLIDIFIYLKIVCNTYLALPCSIK